MLGTCDRVVTVHGCGVDGEIVLLGGGDDALRGAIAAQLEAVGVRFDDAPARLAGADPRNICNRGRTGRGVQLEVSMGLRRSQRRAVLVQAVRKVLLG